MKARVLAVVASLTLVVLAVPVFAHHSFSAEFDRNKRVSLTGVITSVKWQNPHVYFYIDVKDPATNKVTNYGVELGSPNGVLGNGLSKDSLKVGMVVSLNGSMAKDGSAKLNGSDITVNGKLFNAASSEGVTP
jgi:Family of unknown function (DUF6152)